MTFLEMRNKAIKKYKVGQTVTMLIKSYKGETVGKYKAKILKLYPFHVSLLVGNYREGCTYYDFFIGTRKA